MRNLKMIIVLLTVTSLVWLAGCSDDDGPAALELVSITATGADVESGEDVTVDLNGATAAAGVPTTVVITLTFSRELDAATVSSSSISITQDGTDVSATVSATGETVTVTPDELVRGTSYSLSLGEAIAASDGGVFTAASRTFTTGGRAPVVPPNSASQIVYWNFNGDANDQAGSNNPSAEIDVTYTDDRFGQTESAVYFDGETSIIEYPNGSSLMNAEDFTISFWIKTDSEGHVNADGNPTGMFVFGLGAFFGIQYEIFGNLDGSKFAISYANDAGETFSEDMWFPSEATDNTNGGWQGWSFAKSLTVEQMQAIIKDTWYHVIYTFDSGTRTGTLYFNGELMKSFDYNLWPEDSNKATGKELKYRGAEPDVLDEFALGFIHSRGGTMWDAEPWGGYDFTTANHFKGWLDDFRIFHASFSADDADELYKAER